MRNSNARIISVRLAAFVLLASSLACNISASSQGPSAPQPEAVTNIAPLIETQPAEAPAESSNVESAPTKETSPSNDNGSTEGEISEGGSSLGVGGGDLPVTDDIDIRTNVSIKNGDETFEGNISFPGNNTSDDITIKPVDFDSSKSSGKLTFTLICSGRGKAKVSYKGGAVRSGAPGCGETWTIDVVNGSPDSHINIRLDASGNVDWTLSVVSGE